MRRWGLDLLIAWLVVQPCGLAAEVSLCPTAGRVQTAVESLLERRWKHVVRQSLDISCGSAALATILNYQFGDRVSERVLIKTILKHVNRDEVRKRGGFTLLDLKRVAGALGYRVKGYKLSLEQLKHLGSPALVPITIRGFKHFVVFRGMAGDRVIVADPAFGNTLLEESEFTRFWQGIAMVFTKQGRRHSSPSQLNVTEDDLNVAEAHEALRSFMQRGDFHTVVGPDEF